MYIIVSKVGNDMQSLDRAMMIIKIFMQRDSNEFLSITELSKECDLPFSSMHRILKAMIKHRMIEQDKERKLYGLGTLWLEYGLITYDTVDYVSVVRPELDKLMRKVEESVYLTKPLETESLIIERIDCEKNIIRIHDQLGLRLPMNVGAANIAMLAFMSPNQKDNIIKGLEIEEEREKLEEVLEKVKKDGYKASHEERLEGITSVATPIFNHFGEVQGAVSAGLTNFNLTEDKLNFVIQEILETGRIISRKMGYQYNQ